MEKSLASIQEQLKEGVTRLVATVWPKLVAFELLKLGLSTQRTNSREEVAKKIQKLKATGLNQKDIAQRLGVSQPYVSRLIRGPGSSNRAPKHITMQGALDMYGSKMAAAKALGIPRQTFSDRLVKELGAGT